MRRTQSTLPLCTASVNGVDSSTASPIVVAAGTRVTSNSTARSQLDDGCVGAVVADDVGVVVVKVAAAVGVVVADVALTAADLLTAIIERNNTCNAVSPRSFSSAHTHKPQ